MNYLFVLLIGTSIKGTVLSFTMLKAFWKLLDFIEGIERNLNLEARKKFMPVQDGDVPAIYADVKGLVQDAGLKPKISIQQGIANFVN